MNHRCLLSQTVHTYHRTMMSWLWCQSTVIGMSALIKPCYAQLMFLVLLLPQSLFEGLHAPCGCLLCLSVSIFGHGPALDDRGPAEGSCGRWGISLLSDRKAHHSNITGHTRPCWGGAPHTFCLEARLVVAGVLLNRRRRTAKGAGAAEVLKVGVHREGDPEGLREECLRRKLR